MRLPFLARPSTTDVLRLFSVRVSTMRESLYSRDIAPLIITLGGDGGDQYSEGGVGREYLMGAAFRSPPLLLKPRAAARRKRRAGWR